MSNEEMGLCSQRIEHARKLDGNVASTHNGDLLGQGFNVEETITVGAVLGARDLGRDRGLATDSEENLLGVDNDLGLVIECDFDLVLGE